MVLSAMLSITMAVPSSIGVFFFCNVIIVAILVISTFRSSSDVQQPASFASQRDMKNARVFADEGAVIVVAADHPAAQSQDGDDTNALHCSDYVSDEKTAVIVVDEASPAAASIDSRLVVCSTSVKDDQPHALLSSVQSRDLMTAPEMSPARISSTFTEDKPRTRDDNNDDENNNDEDYDDELRRRSEAFIEKVVRRWREERLRISSQVQAEYWLDL